MTAVQGLLSLNSLTEWLSSYPVFNALLTAILPGLALKIFLLLLPWVISTLNYLAGGQLAPFLAELVQHAHFRRGRAYAMHAISVGKCAQGEARAGKGGV